VKFEVRDSLDSDEGFVAKSYVETLRGLLPHRAPARSDAAESAFRHHWHHAIHGKLESTRARVAGPENDSVVIYAFCLPGEFVYVRAAWRGLGLAASLWGGRLSREEVERGKRELLDMLRKQPTSAIFLQPREEQPHG
jgi:hypothetical protein